MCKIFNLCGKDDNDPIPLQFTEAHNDLFQAVKRYKGFDCLNNDRQTNMDEKPSSPCGYYPTFTKFRQIKCQIRSAKT